MQRACPHAPPLELFSDVSATRVATDDPSLCRPREQHRAAQSRGRLNNALPTRVCASPSLDRRRSSDL